MTTPDKHGQVRTSRDIPGHWGVSFLPLFRFSDDFPSVEAVEKFCATSPDKYAHGFFEKDLWWGMGKICMTYKEKVARLSAEGASEGSLGCEPQVFRRSKPENPEGAAESVAPSALGRFGIRILGLPPQATHGRRFAAFTDASLRWREILQNGIEHYRAISRSYRENTRAKTGYNELNRSKFGLNRAESEQSRDDYYLTAIHCRFSSLQRYMRFALID